MVNSALVHIVDDDADVRDSLRALMESVGINVVTYQDATTFFKEYKANPNTPSCMLLDVRMPGLSGMSALQKLHDDGIGLPVFMLTGHGDIPMAVQAMKLGALNFITKPFKHQELLDQVQSVLQASTAQRQAGALTDVTPREIHERWQSLTNREQEVFEHIVNGSSNKAIAIDLDISIRTVESHRARIMEKFQVRTLVDLVLMSVQMRNRA